MSQVCKICSVCGCATYQESKQVIMSILNVNLTASSKSKLELDSSLSEILPVLHSIYFSFNGLDFIFYFRE